MHRVQRRSDCQLLLEKATTSSDSPTTSISSLSTTPSLPFFNSNSDCLKGQQLLAGGATAACAQLKVFEGTNWAAGGQVSAKFKAAPSPPSSCDSCGGAASTALLQQNYVAALAKIKLLEDKVKRLEEQQVEIHTAKELYLKVFEDFPALIWRSGLDKMCGTFRILCLGSCIQTYLSMIPSWTVFGLTKISH